MKGGFLICLCFVQFFAEDEILRIAKVQGLELADIKFVDLLGTWQHFTVTLDSLALESDKDFLMQGGVFSSEVLDTYVEYKKKKEIDAVRIRPHPWEYHLYYDI